MNIATTTITTETYDYPEGADVEWPEGPEREELINKDAFTHSNWLEDREREGFLEKRKDTRHYQRLTVTKQVIQKNTCNTHNNTHIIHVTPVHYIT